ncbi:ABC transporter ATP-binding protein [Lactobacillus panisapium]|uniref:ABC transporter ATP-binding protein n=1 Tax=Lactobacillus panisapium TaxID=2012495 RepID=UPI001C69496C|nr:ABC transporter ATP-binding protein [Lactobacillus panisapium]QYN59337.1 ABC transporter ATP-binding protein [Lactobacillus panisapium]
MKKIALFKITVPFLIGILFGIASNIINLVIPLKIKQTIDLKKLLSNSNNFRLIIIIIILLFAGSIISSLSDFLISREGDKEITNIRLKIQKHLLNLPLSFFNKNLSGELASRVINDSTVVKNFMAQSVPSFVNNTITLLGTIGILLFLDWKMTCLILMIFPLFSLIAIPIGKISKKISADYQFELSKLNGITSESFQNIRSVKLNVAEKNIFRKFRDNLLKLYRLAVKADIINAVVSPFQMLLSYGVVLALILYGGIRVSGGSLSLGTLVSILIYFFQLLPALQSLSGFYNNYKQAIGSMEKITTMINLPIENSTGKEKILNKQQNLVLKNVSFSYDDRIILGNINMKFPEKSKTAIVGPSGAGKTTLINVITKLYPLNSGEILLGRNNSNNYSLSEWRSLFSVVTQENSIMSGTIKDNLLFGLQRNVTDLEIERCLELANLWDDIQKLPKTIYTLVGENGLKLSGGQRQRLQIARSYLRNAQFIIFDEATSNLDADSEKLVTTSMNQLAKEKTLIVIAHRLSTITDSDCIYFIDKNKIQARGTHAELIKSLPSYRKFVNEQMLTKG